MKVEVHCKSCGKKYTLRRYVPSICTHCAKTEIKITVDLSYISLITIEKLQEVLLDDRRLA